MKRSPALLSLILFFISLILLSISAWFFGDIYKSGLFDTIHSISRNRSYENTGGKHPLSRKWIEYAMQITKNEGLSPPSAARLYAYVSSIYADVVKLTNSSSQASLSTMQLIDILAPDQKEKTREFYSSLGQDSSLNSDSEKILQQFVERTQKDSFDLIWDKQIPKDESSWYILSKVDPDAMAGKWVPWIIGPNDKFDIPSPPSYKSLEDKLEVEKVIYATNHRKSVSFEDITFWYNNDVTPAGIWQDILYAETPNPTDDIGYSQTQKILAQALADSYIQAWKTKYHYFIPRPSMRIPGINLVIADPPRPSYVSSLSTISSTAEIILSYLLPDKKNIWKENNLSAQNSDLYSGNHFQMDDKAGQDLGRQVGNKILEKLFPTFHAGRISMDKPHYLSSLLQIFLFKLGPTVVSLQDKTEMLYQLAIHIINHKSQKYTFDDVALRAGIKKGPDSMGVAWADYNNDGFQDLLIMGGRDKTKLYKNKGDGTFTDVTAVSGINPPNGQGSFGGAFAGVFADYDNDGCLDLYITGAGGNNSPGLPDTLYHNNCNGTFTDVTKKAGINDIYHGRGLAWADYNNDGFLDIYVANHGNQISDTEYNFEPNILYKNNGDGTFTDVTAKAGVSGIANCPDVINKGTAKIKTHGGPYKLSFQPIWFDYNNDGLIDLYISTDSGINPLYKNNGDGTFTDVTKDAGLCELGTGMGVTVGDYDNDGFMDIYITNIGKSYLWHNNGDGTFSLRTKEAQAGNDLDLGWGVNFLDYDNDSFLDIYTANGRVSGGVPWDPEIAQVKLDRLYKGNGDGTFSEVSQQEGIEGNYAKEASAFADYNNDGFLDIFVVSSYTEKEALHKLYKNNGNKNHYITIQLVGKKSNRSGVGARVTVVTGDKKQVREVAAGSSYLSENSLWPNFGLGQAKSIDEIIVNWPSGKIQKIKNVKEDQKLVINEEY